MFSVDWDLLTEETFARFRQEVVPLLQANAKVKEITHSMSSSMNINEIDKFNSSIRRDATTFPTFSGKNDDWFAYDRDLLAMAKVQQVDRILKITATIPSEGSRDKAFWNVQIAFLYSVFSSKMTKGQAAIFVREESNTCDAHAVYKKISHHYNADSNRLAIQVRYETKASKLIWDYNYSGGPNKFLGDFQQCILDLEAAKKYPLPDCEKKSKLCLAIKDPQFLSVRDIIASNTNVNYADAITMLENHIMMITPQTSTRRLQQSSRQGNRARGWRCGRGRGRGRGRSGASRGGRTNEDSEWIPPNEWKNMSAAAKLQKIEDRLARSDGLETRSVSTATQFRTVPQAQQISAPPTSVLSLPQGMQPNEVATGTNTGSVIENMMNS
ncbi:MAG: hypothetical protein ACREOZ_01910, partial [Gloeomargaritales cyanobacterium]